MIASYPIWRLNLPQEDLEGNMRVLREISALTLLFVLIGCVPSKPKLYIVKQAARNDTTQKQVFIATTRNLVTKDGVLTASGRRFTNDRTITRHLNRTVNFGRVVVSIPKNLPPGTIKYPPKTPDPKLHYAATLAEDNKSVGTFRRDINRALKKPKNKNDRFIIVFTHGYNTSFCQGVYRHAQLMHDYS